LKALSTFLFANAKSDPAEIEAATRRWPGLSKSWQNWLTGNWQTVGSSFDESAHDASVWLPIDGNGDVRALSNFLFANSGKDTADLETIAKRWSKLSKGDRSGSYDEILAKAQNMLYDNVNDPAFAGEAARWGVSNDDYSKFERRYIASLNTPVPFPLEPKWTASELTGRFIPRNDPRGLFLGSHTNSCQHPNGEAATAAWNGQESPHAGFFVIEDPTGQIAAESWVWQSDNGGLVFDNVEGKGLLQATQEDRDAIKAIYRQTAQDLSQQYHTITIGTGYDKLGLSEFPDAGDKLLKYRSDYSGYTADAEQQRLLAFNPNANAKPTALARFRVYNLDRRFTV
jgi:hypothetical protein